jgi:peptide/nickel transport system permease protein
MRYLTRRLLLLPPLLLSIAVLTFLMVHAIPGSVADIILAEGASPQAVAEFEARLGLADPLPVQFGRWLAGAVQGDLGTSIVLQRPVSGLLLERAGPTLSIAAVGLTTALLIGLVAGIVAGIRAGRVEDRAVMLGATIGISIPEFWMASILALVFAAGLGWFPVIGYTPTSHGIVPWLRSVALPGVALGVTSSALIARQMRGALTDQLTRLYVRAARATGAPRWRITAQATRNAFIPVVTVIGFQIPVLMGAAFIVEFVFAIPGLGDLSVNAILRRDLPVVQGVVLFVATLVILTNALVDVSYTLINPRVRLS